MSKSEVSILILTKNEESNISKCLKSVDWADDIIVFDSQSEDLTTTIAEKHGARIVEREFDNWSSHHNWALTNIRFKHPWVFQLDADETLDEELKTELLQIDADDPKAAYQLRRKDYFMGRWLKRSQLYPTWITRLIRPEKVHYKRLCNPVTIVDGNTDKLQGHLLHQPFSHGIAHWFERHNRYSSWEAADLVKEVDRKLDLGGLVCRDSGRRRRAAKNLAYRLPARPLLVFCYVTFFRLGFLDGIPGIRYALMRACYEYMIDLKVLELRRQTENNG